MIKKETQGMAWGLLGVAAFSLTLPITRFVVPYVEPIFLALMRSTVAAVTAAILLWLSGVCRPSPAQTKKLILVALGVVIGFPVLATIAMQTVPASQGGVVLGVLPIVTAIISVFISHERPGRGFWFSQHWAAHWLPLILYNKAAPSFIPAILCCLRPSSALLRVMP